MVVPLPIREEMRYVQAIVNSDEKSVLRVLQCTDTQFFCRFRAHPTNITLKCILPTNYPQEAMTWSIDDDRTDIDLSDKGLSFTKNLMRIVFQLCQKFSEDFPPSMRELNKSYYSILVSAANKEIYESNNVRMLPTTSTRMFCSGCKRHRSYIPRIICSERDHLIKENAAYYLKGNKIICENCFSATDNPGTLRKQINKGIEETFVGCKECGAYWHRVCALHIDQIWTSGFVCSKCLENRGQKRLENIYTAKNLPTNKLSDFLEKRVKKFIRKNGMKTDEITIRVVSAADGVTFLSKRMKSYLRKRGRSTAVFPHVTKFILMFYEIDGQDVCSFALYVREYGSKCPEPNRRCVYIANSDCLPFISPAHYRFALHCQLLLGYLKYLKQLGYLNVYVWPHVNSDQIFYAHPLEQDLSSMEEFPNWYMEMWKEGLHEKIIRRLTCINWHNDEEKKFSIRKIPYFTGDIMQTLLDEILEKNKREFSKIVNQCALDRFIESKIEKELSKKLIDDDFEYIIADLQAVNEVDSEETIQDPDDLYPSKIMKSCNSFFQFAKENHLEFSSIRRAKFSTMVLLYELHREREKDSGFPEYFGIRLLIHANICLEDNCCVDHCKNTREDLKHFRGCRNHEGCFTCTRIREIIWKHIEECSAYSCNIPHCALLKNRIRLNEAKRKLAQQISHH